MIILQSSSLLVFLVFLVFVESSSSLVLVFSGVFWRIHVSPSDVPFSSLSTPFFFFSIVVLFGLLLVFPRPPGAFSGGIPRKGESY